MPLQATSGAASYDAFGGGKAVVPNYIEDVFSTYLYTGNGSTQTITNGIDLATKGGMVWIKDRTSAFNNVLGGTATGTQSYLRTNATTALSTGDPTTFTSFNSNGFGIGAQSWFNNTSDNFVSWTFRKQPKFFDVVTWVGDGTTTLKVAHNLQSIPGFVAIKAVSTTGNWNVVARESNSSYIFGDGGAGTAFALNTTDIPNGGGNFVSLGYLSSTTFTPGRISTASTSNANGVTYVAYLFAHNAGGFGLTGTDNVISCGSFTTDSSGGCSVNLGYEPQFLLTKRTDGTSQWEMYDVMRGLSQTSTAGLYANTSGAETNYGTSTSRTAPASTGFEAINWFTASATYIYIAIRRGPMKVPTSGMSVFSPATPSTDYSPITTGFPVDMFFDALRAGQASNTFVGDRLRGQNTVLRTASTSAEISGAYGGSNGFQSNTTVTPYLWGSGAVVYNFQRAPSFFDEVCYTGTGTAGQTFAHNLGVVPELMIVKCRSNASSSWRVLYQPIGIVGQLESTATVVTTNREFYFGDDTNYISPTASVFTVASNSSVNTSARTYVAYLFATCAGVSKVGSYTGTGATQTIACGFTGGARFVLIKRTDSTGNWGVLDTARGMVSGTDPYLNLNTTAAEVNANNVYTTTGGFQLVSSDANFNANGGTYIFLAIA